jgi:hypothetical protein
VSLPVIVDVVDVEYALRSILSLIPGLGENSVPSFRDVEAEFQLRASTIIPVFTVPFLRAILLFDARVSEEDTSAPIVLENPLFAQRKKPRAGTDCVVKVKILVSFGELPVLLTRRCPDRLIGLLVGLYNSIKSLSFACPVPPSIWTSLITI